MRERPDFVHCVEVSGRTYLLAGAGFKANGSGGEKEALVALQLIENSYSTVGTMYDNLYS